MNEVKLVDGKPKRRDANDKREILENCWDGEEARQFLKVACESGPQPAASIRSHSSSAHANRRLLP